MQNYGTLFIENRTELIFIMTHFGVFYCIWEITKVQKRKKSDQHWLTLFFFLKVLCSRGALSTGVSPHARHSVPGPQTGKCTCTWRRAHNALRLWSLLAVCRQPHADTVGQPRLWLPSPQWGWQRSVLCSAFLCNRTFLYHSAIVFCPDLLLRASSLLVKIQEGKEVQAQAWGC